MRILSAGELGIAGEDCGLCGSPTRVKRVERQTAGRRHVKLLGTVEELAERLKAVSYTHLSARWSSASAGISEALP